MTQNTITQHMKIKTFIKYYEKIIISNTVASKKKGPLHKGNIRYRLNGFQKPSNIIFGRNWMPRKISTSVKTKYCSGNDQEFKESNKIN